jgi:PmbA protein
MERGGEGRSTRHAADLPRRRHRHQGREPGRRAPEPAQDRLDHRPGDLREPPGHVLIGPLIGAISGPSIARGTSFLKDKLGQQIFAKGVNLLDDPHRVRGLGSAPFDDEGVA